MDIHDIEVTREQHVNRLRAKYGTLQDAIEEANREIERIHRDLNDKIDDYNAEVKDAREFLDGLDTDEVEVGDWDFEDLTVDCPYYDFDDECLVALELEDLDLMPVEEDE